MKQRYPSRQWCFLLNAKPDENWKMTVISGIFVAGAVVLIKALLPMALTIAYITGLRSRRLPRFDLDLLASWVNGRSLQPAPIQPRHPFIPNR
jgi:hypothetical protein